MTLLKKPVAFILILSFILGFVCCMICKIDNNNPNVCSIRIEDSYLIWSPEDMKLIIQAKSYIKYGNNDAGYVLHRDYKSMYVEWWFHNIGYYVTKPFCFIEYFNKINLRCKDVDLEEWD